MPRYWHAEDNTEPPLRAPLEHVLLPPGPCATPRQGCHCEACLLRAAGQSITRLDFARWLVQTGRLTDADELTGPERAALRQVAERRERR